MISTGGTEKRRNFMGNVKGIWDILGIQWNIDGFDWDIMGV